MLKKDDISSKRSDRLLNDIGRKVWDELAIEYGTRSLKRIASAGIVVFHKLPHEGRIKALAIVNGRKDIDLTLEVISDEEELERLLFREKQIKAKLKRGIKKESERRKHKDSNTNTKSA